MENINIFTLLVVGAFVGASAGYLGSFMVLKRMSLVGDALSHVALPGMAIALTLNSSPMLGAFLALTIAVIGIWYFEETSRLYPEALVGIFFTASLAIGILITPEPELLEALFGNIETVNPLEAVIAVILSLVLIFITYKISRSLILMIISKDLAKSLGMDTKNINLLFLLMVGLVVALGVKFTGTLLMGALVIVPAASAKNIGKSLISYHIYSVVFGIASVVGGILTAESLQLPTGPLVVLTSIAIYLVTHVAYSLRHHKIVFD